jgi:hypothetical protein
VSDSVGVHARMRTVTTSLPFEAHLSGLTVVQHLPSFTLGAETPSNRRSARAYQGARPDERGSERHWQESKATDSSASQSDSSSSPFIPLSEPRRRTGPLSGPDICRLQAGRRYRRRAKPIRHSARKARFERGLWSIDDARNYLGLVVLWNRRLAKTVAEVRRR